MIKNAKFTNYRCFEELSVSLAPFTVLVGPNNTGKSTFLAGLANSQHYAHGSFGLPDCHRGCDAKDVEIRLTTSADVEVTLSQLNADAVSVKISRDRIDQLASVMPIRYFDIPKLRLSMVSKGVGSRVAISELVPNDGSNIPTLLDHMLRKERTRFFDLIETLKSMIHGLEDIDVDTPSPEQREVFLILDNGFRIPASHASMGVRLMIFFACLAYHPDPPKVILIEEPETGVHPKRLAEIVKLLRSITTGAKGATPAQVILSTHSPYLLDCVDLDTDSVLVFQREENGNRTATPMNAERLKEYMDDYMLGEFWFNGGEEVLIGGESSQ